MIQERTSPRHPSDRRRQVRGLYDALWDIVRVRVCEEEMPKTYVVVTIIGDGIVYAESKR